MSWSIWFSFYPCAFYSFFRFRVPSISTSFISPLLKLLQSTKILVNHLFRTKCIRIIETRHDGSNPVI